MTKTGMIGLKHKKVGTRVKFRNEIVYWQQEEYLNFGLFLKMKIEIHTFERLFPF